MVVEQFDVSRELTIEVHVKPRGVKARKRETAAHGLLPSTLRYFLTTWRMYGCSPSICQVRSKLPGNPRLTGDRSGTAVGDGWVCADRQVGLSSAAIGSGS